MSRVRRRAAASAAVSALERETSFRGVYGVRIPDGADDAAPTALPARAQVVRDHEKAAQIWKPTDGVWWRGPQDPNVCVLRVQPLMAELWDGPSSAAVANFEFAKARLTGEKPNLGENRKVTVEL